MPQLEPEWGIHQRGLCPTSPRASKVQMLQAQLRGVQTKTLNITMSLPSRTALATSQASALVGNILSFTRTKLYAPLKVEPLRCFGISWFVFMCFPVTWCISVYSFTVHQMCRVPSINLPVLELCPAKKRHLHGGQHLGGCDGDLSSLLWDSRESSVGEFLEPTRTMAKTSPDSRFGILQKPFPTSARNLGTSGTPPKNRNLPRFTHTESEPPGTCPKLSRPKALDSLRHHLPSPCDILVLGGKHWTFVEE